MDELYKAYKDRDDVQFIIIYTREPHARQPLGPEYNFIRLGQPKTYKERVEYAKACQKRRGIDIPLLIDTMDGQVQKAYGGLPNNVVIVDKDGKVAARKAWNDALFVELSLRDIVENPPVVKHTGTMGMCEECHSEAVASIAKEHPMTDCSVCHTWFFNTSMISAPDARAKKHSRKPEAPIGREISCSALCHNTEYLPQEHDITGLPFAHVRHINRDFTCMDCHVTEGHAFHDVSESTCLNCHKSPGSKDLKPGVKAGSNN